MHRTSKSDPRGSALSPSGFCCVDMEKASLQHTEAQGPDGRFRQWVLWELREGKDHPRQGELESFLERQRNKSGQGFPGWKTGDKNGQG